MTHLSADERLSRVQLYEHADGLLINAELLSESRARQLRNAAYALKAAADDLALLANAGCRVREHNGHRFVEITSDRQP